MYDEEEHKKHAEMFTHHTISRSNQHSPLSAKLEQTFVFGHLESLRLEEVRGCCCGAAWWCSFSLRDLNMMRIVRLT